jgi:DNA polymerase III epsilon subunit-like protein
MYIVFDMEFNQNEVFQKNSPIPNPYETINSNPLSSPLSIGKKHRLPSEIIQIGAYKLDERLNIIASFNRFIKPSIYETIDPRITEMTGITTEQLQEEASFPEVFKDFLAFIDNPDAIFCTWGMSDMKVLFQNAKDFGLDTDSLPKRYINLQPYVSLYFKLPKKKLLRLQVAIEALDLPITEVFHNALNDAYYTAMILQKIYTPYLQPQKYDPTYTKVKPRQKKRVIDFHGLIRQFEKMYHREMTEEEIEMITLAYKMGRTNQFIKEPPS